MTKKTEDQPTLTAAFSELEALTTEFEQGEIDLEKAISKFKRGLELSKYLQNRLQEIENEITEIKADFTKTEKKAKEDKQEELELEEFDFNS